TIRSLLRRALVALVRPAHSRAHALAHPDDSQRALTGAPVEGGADGPEGVDGAGFSPRLVAALFAASLVACMIAYLVVAVPGRWFTSVPEKAYGPAQLTMSRGVAALAGDELVVTRAADDGNTVVSATTDLRATEFPVIAWIAAG